MLISFSAARYHVLALGVYLECYLRYRMLHSCDTSQFMLGVALRLNCVEMHEHHRTYADVMNTAYVKNHWRRLRVESGATAPGPALEGAPRFRTKIVLMSLSSYIIR
jgi:hypothetical protein